MQILGFNGKTQKKDTLKSAKIALFFMKLLGCATVTIVGSSILCNRQVVFAQFQFWVVQFLYCRSDFLPVRLRQKSGYQIAQVDF